MPHLRIRSIDEKNVRDLTLSLIPELSKMTGAPEEHFSVEHIPSIYYAQGRQIEGDPFCEILWFDRGAEIQDQVARLVTAHLAKIKSDKDIVVVFTLFPKTHYYENGQHFGSK